MGHYIKMASVADTSKAVLIVGAIVAAIFLFSTNTQPDTRTSDFAEARFSDESPSGLAVVPASGGTVTGTYTGTYTASYVPASPTNVTATCNAAGTSATLTWTNAAGATGYYLRIDNQQNTWTPTYCDGRYHDTQPYDICTPPTAQSGYTFSTVSGAPYSIWIHSNNDAGYSAAVTVAMQCNPTTPANFSLSCNGTTGTVNWTPPSGATGYYIRADDQASPWTPARCDGTVNDTSAGDYCWPVTTAQPFTFTTQPGHNYTLWVYPIGASGYNYTPATGTMTCPLVPPTCSVTVTPNPIARGASATVSYSSANATSFSLTTIGAVTPNTSNSTTVSPSATTNYGGTATGPGGTVTCPATLTVTEPTAALTLNGAASVTVNTGATVTRAWSSTNGASYSSTYTINAADGCGDGVGPNAWTINTASGSGTFVVPACQAGRTYTYAYRVQNSAGYAVTASATMIVRPLPSCSITATPSSIIRGQASSIGWTSSNSTSGTINPGAVNASPVASGSFSAAPNTTTVYSGSFTGAGGTAACTPATLTVTCAPIYSCSGETIQFTNASCATSNVTTCVAPASCVPGQSACINPPPAFTAGTGTTGHLEVIPLLVRKGQTSKLFWNVSNVTSCTVNGSNGDIVSGGCSGNTCTSGISGATTDPIETSAIYTLSCTALSGNSFVPESVTVLPSPEYVEI